MNLNRSNVVPRRIIGDFDASGTDIERDWIARTGCWTRTERVLLTHDQVRAYALPPAEGKKDYPRWPAFARRYGFDTGRPVQWEVEALPPEELHHLGHRRQGCSAPARRPGNRGGPLPPRRLGAGPPRPPHHGLRTVSLTRGRVMHYAIGEHLKKDYGVSAALPRTRCWTPPATAVVPR